MTNLSHLNLLLFLSNSYTMSDLGFDKLALQFSILAEIELLIFNKQFYVLTLFFKDDTSRAFLLSHFFSTSCCHLLTVHTTDTSLWTKGKSQLDIRDCTGSVWRILHKQLWESLHISVSLLRKLYSSIKVLYKTCIFIYVIYHYNSIETYYLYYIMLYMSTYIYIVIYSAI